MTLCLSLVLLLAVTAAVLTGLSARNLDVTVTAVGGTDANGTLIAVEPTARPLSEERLDRLRAVARSQGTYRTGSTGWTVPEPESHARSVLFFDLPAGETVDLTPLARRPRVDAPTAARPSCPDGSLVVIVRGGGALLSQHTDPAVVVYVDGKPGESAAKLDTSAHPCLLPVLPAPSRP